MREDVNIRLGQLYKVPVYNCEWCKGLRDRNEYCDYHQWLLEHPLELAKLNKNKH